MKNVQINIVLLISILLLSLSCSKEEEEDDDNTQNQNPTIGVCGSESTYTDMRDGKVYNIIQIGTLCMFAENLSYASEDSRCYNDNANLCNTYGRLYTKEDAINSCPQGWRIPTNEEWMIMADFLGGVDSCGAKMKEMGTVHWDDPNFNASNESEFNGLPGGFVDNGGQYDRLGKDAYFWTSTVTEINENYTIYRGLSYINAALGEYSTGQNYGFSVRCVKD